MCALRSITASSPRMSLTTGSGAIGSGGGAEREGARSDIDASPRTLDGPSAVRCIPSALWQPDPRGERSYGKSCFKSKPFVEHRNVHAQPGGCRLGRYEEWLFLVAGRGDRLSINYLPPATDG